MKNYALPIYRLAASIAGIGWVVSILANLIQGETVFEFLQFVSTEQIEYHPMLDYWMKMAGLAFWVYWLRISLLWHQMEGEFSVRYLFRNLPNFKLLKRTINHGKNKFRQSNLPNGLCFFSGYRNPYDPFPTPKVRLLEMVAPTVYKASLVEPPIEGDASSTQTDEALPGYNCFDEGTWSASPPLVQTSRVCTRFLYGLWR